MASTIGETDEAFPEVNVTRQLNLGVPEEFPVDPVSSKVAISKAHKVFIIKVLIFVKQCLIFPFLNFVGEYN